MTKQIDLGSRISDTGDTTSILTHGQIKIDGATPRISLGSARVLTDAVAGGPLVSPNIPARKYFINYDQNVLESATVKTNIATYETYPFDGMRLTVNLDPHPLYGAPASPNLCGLGDSYWTTTALPWPAWSAALSNVQTTNFIKFQANFLELKIQPSATLGLPPCDWYNPAFENSVIHNTRMAARFCRAGFLKGFWFDPEPLSSTAGWSIWKYSDRPYASTYSFEEYKTKARYWGRRWMEVAQEEYPDIEIVVAFLYGFATTGSTSTYGLYGSFLDGVMDARRGNATIVEWGEEMYSRYEQSYLEYFKYHTYDEAPTNSSTSFYRARAGSAIRMDASPFDGDATLFQSGLENQYEYGSDKYVNLYQQTRRFLAGTATSSEVAALRAARVAKGIDQTFDPSLIKGLVAYINPEALGLSNGATISSFVDATGNTWTSSGSPTYTSTGVNTTHGGLNIASASSQYFTANSIASTFTGTDVPFTIIQVYDFGSLPGVAMCSFTLGNSGDANNRISIRFTGAPLLTVQRVSTSGTSDSAFGSSPTYTPTTAATIAAVVCNGSLGTAMTINGSNVGDASAKLYDPQATIGAQAFDRATLGASIQNSTPSQYFNGVLGSFLIFNRALGSEELRYIVQGLGRQYGITVV